MLRFMSRFVIFSNYKKNTPKYIFILFYKKLKNVSYEHDRLNETQLCKLHGTSDTFVGRPYSVFRANRVSNCYIQKYIYVRAFD